MKGNCFTAPSLPISLLLTTHTHTHSHAHTHTHTHFPLSLSLSLSSPWAWTNSIPLNPHFHTQTLAYIISLTHTHEHTLIQTPTHSFFMPTFLLLHLHRSGVYEKRVAVHIFWVVVNPIAIEGVLLTGNCPSAFDNRSHFHITQ